jgi:hypothetical protein
MQPYEYLRQMSRDMGGGVHAYEMPDGIRVTAYSGNEEATFIRAYSDPISPFAEVLDFLVAQQPVNRAIQVRAEEEYAAAQLARRQRDAARSLPDPFDTPTIPMNAECFNCGALYGSHRGNTCPGLGGGQFINADEIAPAPAARSGLSADWLADWRLTGTVSMVDTCEHNTACMSLHRDGPVRHGERTVSDTPDAHCDGCGLDWPDAARARGLRNAVDLPTITLTGGTPIEQIIRNITAREDDSFFETEESDVL